MEWKVNLWNSRDRQPLVKRFSTFPKDPANHLISGPPALPPSQEEADWLTYTRSTCQWAPSGWLLSGRSTAWSECLSSGWSPPSSEMALVSPYTLHTWRFNNRRVNVLRRVLRFIVNKYCMNNIPFNTNTNSCPKVWMTASIVSESSSILSSVCSCVTCFPVNTRHSTLVLVWLRKSQWKDVIRLKMW